MKSLQKVLDALEQSKYSIRSWGFEDEEHEEPVDCKDWCIDWFNSKPLIYQIGKISFSCRHHNKDDCAIEYLIDFTDALNAFWAAEGFAIYGAHYSVILGVDS